MQNTALQVHCVLSSGQSFNIGNKTWMGYINGVYWCFDEIWWRAFGLWNSEVDGCEGIGSHVVHVLLL